MPRSVLLIVAALCIAVNAADDIEVSVRARSLQPGELVVLTAVTQPDIMQGALLLPSG